MIVKVLVLRSFSVSGIRFGLKMLTVLFIGGASGSAQLLGCQRTDGAGGRFVAPHLISASKCGAFQGSIRRRMVHFATVLVQLRDLVLFLRQNIEGVCLPPAFSTRTL